MAAKQKRAADAAPSSARPAASKPDFVFTRVIDAPRELVWQAWTKPEHLAQWFGPQGFTVPESAMDLRPGGAIRIVMRSPDGKDFVNTGVVREVAPPERLVFATALLGEGGAPVLEDLNTLTLETQGTKTKLTLIARVTKMAPEAAAAAAGIGDGWNETLDRLEQHVSMRELVITRVFDAPRELVWAAWTEPKHLTKWWGPKGVTTPIYEVDLRVGGAFRLCMILPPDGREHWVKGVYREVVPPKRLVVTGEMDDPKVTFTGAVTFEEHNGKTTLTLRTTHPGFMSADANVGWNGSFDKLAVYLERVA